MLISLEHQIDKLCEYSQQPYHRVGTGLPTVDKACGGPAPGEVFTIIARSYVGKSILAQNIISNNRTMPSIFFSLEMPYIQALIRLYSIWSGLPSWETQKMIESGDLPDNIYGLVDAFPLHRLVDRAGLSIDQMSRYVEQFQDSLGMLPEFVVVDYLELVGGAKAGGGGYEATESQVTQLKDWAKTYNTRIFLLHQCNKSEPIWEAPTENSPRNGGFTESDYVIGLWRPHRNPDLDQADMRYFRDKMFVNVLKNRAFGENVDEIVLKFQPSLRLVETGTGNVTVSHNPSGFREEGYEYSGQAGAVSEEQSWDNLTAFGGS